MGLPLFKTFTEEQLKQFGPARDCEVLLTERCVYTTPFMYENVTASDFYEIDPTKGIEFKADTGILTISEDKPILAVTVVGSGCYYGGYNICEWWDGGESIDNMKNQLVKRQRIDGLNGTHPGIFSQILMGTFPGLMYRNVAMGLKDDIKDRVDCLKKHSDGYYEDYHMGFYENTAHFKLGPPYPHKITIRCGCKLPEVPGCTEMQPKADYAIRVVETIVIK